MELKRCLYLTKDKKMCNNNRYINSLVCITHYPIIRDIIEMKKVNGTPLTNIEESCNKYNPIGINKCYISSVNGECAICLEEDIKVCKLMCSHAICEECKYHLREPLCPICRRDITKALTSIEIRNITLRQKRDKKEREAYIMQH